MTGSPRWIAASRCTCRPATCKHWTVMPRRTLVKALTLPLITLCKSKGQDHHTVIFAGLDDDAWRSYIQEPVDVAVSFCPAFSRAKQRVIFTYSPKRTKVALLDRAGVPRIAVA